MSVQTASPVSLLLRVIAGGKRGEEIRLGKGEFFFGRSSQCDYHIDIELISRKHCVVRFCGDHFEVEDLSQNGTFVNGKRIAEKTQLCDGDWLRVGTRVFVVRLAENG